MHARMVAVAGALVFLLLLLRQPRSVVSYDTVVVGEDTRYRKIELTTPVTGPESIAFDPQGGGPYTGVSDGRILKWSGYRRGWSEFAVPPRPSGVSRRECDEANPTDMEARCGRPLGLQFHKSTGRLYVADAYFGLLSVGRRGGVATQLATSAGGVLFNFTNGVDVDQRSGIVYFTDSSTRYQRRDWLWCVVSDDATGRFMSYNPTTNRVKVLLQNLQFPNGVAVSGDGRYVLIVETTPQRVLRYWLRGARRGTHEVFANVTFFPDNIKRSPGGDFWVALNTGGGGGAAEGEEETEEVTMAVRLGGRGEVVEELSSRRREMLPLSEVEEKNGTLWLGSVVSSFVGVYRVL